MKNPHTFSRKLPHFVVSLLLVASCLWTVFSLLPATDLMAQASEIDNKSLIADAGQNLLLSPLSVAVSSKPMFFIKRSMNTNEVHYDVKLDGCKMTASPIDTYWRNLKEGPNASSEMLEIVEDTYKCELRSSSPNKITFDIAALPSLIITASISDCKLTTTIPINGEPANFSSVYIHLTETSILELYIPIIDAVDILGYRNGKKVWQRIVKTSKGNSLPKPQDSFWKSGVGKRGRP